MESKSRVILYQEYRDQIAKMDEYSFSENSATGEHAQQVEGQTPLTSSLDELMQKQEQRVQEEEIKNTKRLYKEKVRAQKKKEGNKTLFFIILALAILLVLGIGVLVFFLIKGV